MVIALLLILILLAALGVLGFVVKVAFAVALGVMLGFVLLAGLVWWRVRRALLGTRRDQWRRIHALHRHSLRLEAGEQLTDVTADVDDE